MVLVNVDDMQNKNWYIDKIQGFKELLPGWDTYNADAISPIAITIALDLIEFFNGYISHKINIHIFPMCNGGIQFEFDKSKLYSELEINPEGKIQFIMYDKNGDKIIK